MRNSLIFLVDALSDLYVAMFVLRFIMQWTRASYQNPLAQFVLQVTAPLVVPARRMLPSIRGVDVPTLVLAVALECVATLLLFVIAGFTPSLDTFVMRSGRVPQPATCAAAAPPTVRPTRGPRAVITRSSIPRREARA